MSAYAMDVTLDDFHAKVIEASRRVPVLVDFWAPWCGPCRALGPVLEKLAKEYNGRFILAKVNSDENQQLAMQLGVRGIPNVKAFVNGEMVDEFTGALPEAQVRAFLENLMPSPAEPLRQQALAAKARGQLHATRKLLLEAIKLDPRHEAARLDLIEMMIDAKDVEDAGRLLDEVADRARDTARVEALRARLDLVANSGAGTDAAALAQRIAADPGDMEARYQLANQLALAKDYRGAMAQALEIVRRDRRFRDDAGRRMLVNLFSLAGDADLVREYRSALASALN